MTCFIVFVPLVAEYIAPNPFEGTLGVGGTGVIARRGQQSRSARQLSYTTSSAIPPDGEKDVNIRLPNSK